MIHTQLTEFINASILNKNWALLGLDIGSKKIGVAYTSHQANVVLPLTTINNPKLNIRLNEIRSLIYDRKITGIVAGWPLEMSGNPGIQTENIKKFLDKILKKVEIAIYLQDERLSTAMANRLLIDAEFTRQKRNNLDDQISAALILESFLSIIKSKPNIR